MPDLDADRSAHDHHCFSTGHPEEFPETFRDKQPATSRQLQLTVTAGEQPAKLLEVGDLLFQFPRFEFAGDPIESVGQLYMTLSTPFHVVGSVWFQVAQKSVHFNFGGGWSGDVTRDGAEKTC